MPQPAPRCGGSAGPRGLLLAAALLGASAPAHAGDALPAQHFHYHGDGLGWFASPSAATLRRWEPAVSLHLGGAA